jgi:phosphoribosylformylglycinamidine synthase
VPSLDVAAAARLVRLMSDLARSRLIRAAHDCSVGGLGVALARMAIAAGTGAAVKLAAQATHATAVAFGERAGRVIVSVAADRAAGLRRALHDATVSGRLLGIAGGDRLDLRIGPARVTVPVAALSEAWRSPF